VYTRISKNDLAKFPDVKMYMNLHANNPKPIGDSVSCGEVLVIKRGER
jgi:hypothetical protein